VAAWVPVYLEQGAKRAFACAYDWPGWCRSGKDERTALEALADYAPRYAAVASEAGLPFGVAAGDLEVVDRVPGSATTDFGAPAAVAPRDAEPLDRPEAERLAALVEAAWRALERVAAGAPAELRKGPRGGGRDRDEILEHVAGAEEMYARKLGLRLKPPELRPAILEALRSAGSGEEAAEGAWPPRYAARRIAWHALDHAWEIEDRSG
jgi:hypothetical protein